MQQRKLNLQIRYNNKKLTNTKICSVVDGEFERVRGFKYFPLIITEDDVNY